MLPRNTTPGTRVICINAQDCEGYLIEGEAYTVMRIAMGRDINPGSPFFGKIALGVTLVEVDPPPRAGVELTQFSARRFRPAVLPKCLTDMLVPEMN